jgi:hypothetical protein
VISAHPVRSQSPIHISRPNKEGASVLLPVPVPANAITARPSIDLSKLGPGGCAGAGSGAGRWVALGRDVHCWDIDVFTTGTLAG